MQWVASSLKLALFVVMWLVSSSFMEVSNEKRFLKLMSVAKPNCMYG